MYLFINSVMSVFSSFQKKKRKKKLETRVDGYILKLFTSLYLWTITNMGIFVSREWRVQTTPQKVQHFLFVRLLCKNTSNYFRFKFHVNRSPTVQLSSLHHTRLKAMSNLTCSVMLFSTSLTTYSSMSC